MTMGPQHQQLALMVINQEQLRRWAERESAEARKQMKCYEQASSATDKA